MADRIFLHVGYRTAAWLLGVNKNTVQRIFQIKGWQVRKLPIGFRQRIQSLPSVATAPNERVVYRPVPYLGRPGRLGHAGAGDRLPYYRSKLEFLRKSDRAHTSLLVSVMSLKSVY